ncbi:MAG: RDD family protein [Balneola sp.]|nr:MAG: RDD family protein [Balneola sp.]
MEKEINAGIRISSMVLDHFIMTFVTMIFFIPGMISTFITAFQISHEQVSPDIFGGLSFIGLIGFALYFCKDSINGQSIAKRILKLQVVDKRTEKAASPLKCLVRNLFCMIWPIEVIMALVNPGRRIGDMVAGTKVVPFNSEIEQPEPNYTQMGIAFALALGLMLLFSLPFVGLNELIKSNQVSYIEASINNSASQEIAELFESEFGNELTADVRVYDRIKAEPNLKYISVILTLDKNHLTSNDDFVDYHNKALSVLLSRHAEGTFVGQIRYVYKETGNMITRTKPLDWREK